MIAALYIDPRGPYPSMPDVDCWDEARDARLYDGPYPVGAHPPCFLWVNLAAVNWKRYQRELPAWYPGGSDGGCFAAALAAVRRFGGVLEHPAGSWAWREYGLKRPEGIGWQADSVLSPSGHSYVCEIWQSAYGHKARKRAWLYYVADDRPADLDWARAPATHQVGWFDRIKPTLSKKEASASPSMFARCLVDLAAASISAERERLEQLRRASGLRSVP